MTGDCPCKIKDRYAIVLGVKSFKDDIDRLLTFIRSSYPQVTVQAVDPSVIYGKRHIVGILAITIEASDRNCLAAERQDIDILLRFACTNQISVAIKKAGAKKNQSVCFLMYSKDKNQLHMTDNELRLELGQSICELKYPAIESNDLIKDSLHNSRLNFDKAKLIDLLIEKASLIMR